MMIVIPITVTTEIQRRLGVLCLFHSVVESHGPARCHQFAGVAGPVAQADDPNYKNPRSGHPNFNSQDLSSTLDWGCMGYLGPLSG